MIKSISLPLFAFLGIALFLSGCAQDKHTKRQVRILQAQMGQVTDELVRLDEALQETRSAIQAEENRLNQLETQIGQSKSRLKSLREEESIISGIYRTPSGFELPSANIQQALKNAGYYRGNLDGKIGPQTRQAILSFQRDNGLITDGVVGRKTWGKLQPYMDRIK